MLQMNLSNACEEYVSFRLACGFDGRKVRRDRFRRSQRMPGFHRMGAHLCQPPAGLGADRPTCGGFAGLGPSGLADSTARGAISAIMVLVVARIGLRAVVSRGRGGVD